MYNILQEKAGRIEAIGKVKVITGFNPLNPSDSSNWATYDPNKGGYAENGTYHDVRFGVSAVGRKSDAEREAKKNGLNFVTVEQDTLGGTVFSFPRKKIVMTSPLDLPLYGKVKFTETNKQELINLWNEVLSKNNISINTEEKITGVQKVENYFEVTSSKKTYTTQKILLAIGRRGSPRKLGVPGENSEKVAYRLLEPELIKNSNVLVVGGGDSAVESAMLLADEGENNKVYLSYRNDSFKRIKPRNSERLSEFEKLKKIEILYSTNVKQINEESVIISGADGEFELPIDQIYVFAGGELPNKFLENIGITITKKFGEAVLKH